MKRIMDTQTEKMLFSLHHTVSEGRIQVKEKAMSLCDIRETDSSPLLFESPMATDFAPMTPIGHFRFLSVKSVGQIERVYPATHPTGLLDCPLCGGHYRNLVNQFQKILEAEPLRLLTNFQEPEG